MYLDDPWTLPSPRSSDEDPRLIKMEMLLSAAEVAYQAILDPIVDPGPSSSQMEEGDLLINFVTSILR